MEKADGEMAQPLMAAEERTDATGAAPSCGGRPGIHHAGRGFAGERAGRGYGQEGA